MKLTKRKIFALIGWILLTLFLLLITSCVIIGTLNGAASRRFERSHAEAIGRARAMLTHQTQAPETHPALNQTSHTAGSITPPAAGARPDFLMDGLVKFERPDHAAALNHVRMVIGGAGACNLILPAETYLQAAVHGPLAANRKLIKRIEEAQGRQRREHPRETTTTQPQSVPAIPSELDEAERFLLGAPWGMTDNALRGLQSFPGGSSLDAFAQGAILRAAARHDEAGTRALLSAALKACALERVMCFPNPLSLNGLRGLLLAGAERNLFSAAMLAQLDADLRALRWDAGQVADLRALHAARLHTIYNTSIRTALAMKGFMKVAGIISIPVGFVAEKVLRPSVQAWADGRENDYLASIPTIQALAVPVQLQLALYFPPSMIAPNLEASPINEELDLTRLVLAGVRFKKSAGRYPARLEELIPAYLDSSWLPTPDSCWVVENMEALPPLAPGQPRPIFAHLRRTATPEALLRLARNVFSIYQHEIDAPPAESTELQQYLHDKQGVPLDILMVKAVWPEPERLTWDRADTLFTTARN